MPLWEDYLKLLEISLQLVSRVRIVTRLPRVPTEMIAGGTRTEIHLARVFILVPGSRLQAKNPSRMWEACLSGVHMKGLFAQSIKVTVGGITAMRRYGRIHSLYSSSCVGLQTFSFFGHFFVCSRDQGMKKKTIPKIIYILLSESKI